MYTYIHILKYIYAKQGLVWKKITFVTDSNY